MNTFEHGGNIHKILRESPAKDQQILDFSANINPLGPPEWFRPLISSQLENLIHYPDPDNTEFIKAIAEHTGVSTEHIVVGNGTTELLYAFLRVLPCKRVILPVPSYVDYARAAKVAGLSVVAFTLDEEDDFTLNLDTLGALIQADDLVIIATPNNPTGKDVDHAQLLSLIKNCPASYFLIDEAFADFIEGTHTLGGKAPNILTLNSMTKFYGVPGLRIGYGILSPSLAGQVKENLPPWTVNSLAQAVGTAALRDTVYQSKTRQVCQELRLELADGLRRMHQLKVYDSKANYLFIKVVNGGTATAVADFCLQHGIMIRRCDNYQGLALPQLFFRIAVRTQRENLRLLEVLDNFFDGATPRKSPSQDLCR